MSLVNDALRRASEAQAKTNPEPPKLTLRPAAPPQAHKGMGMAWPISLALFVGAICLIGWLNQGDNSLPVQARTPESQSKAAPAAISAAAQAASITNPPSPVIEPAKPAPLKLQAVFLAPRNPSAIINGQTVFVGDSVRDLKVAAIASNSALLIGATKTNLLTLE